MEQQPTKKGHRRGSMLANAVVLMFVLVMTGAAFMKWAADEAHQATFDLARTQAYYVAQKGVMETGLKELMTSSIIELPQGDYPYAPGNWERLGSESGFDPTVQFRGRYIDAHLVETATDTQSIYHSSQGQYRAYATGVVQMTMPNGQVRNVARKYGMDIKLRSYADYMYLTNFETTRFNEIIWFYSPDTLYGRVHSNDKIGIKQQPTFMGPVSTTADEFEEHNANAHFEYDPQFNAPNVFFPTEASELRAAASASGTYITDEDGTFWTRVVGGEGGWTIYQWDAGTPFDDEDAIQYPTIPYGTNVVIFVEGLLEIKGDQIQGRSSIGSEGNMYLIDNVKYADVSIPELEVDMGSTNILGLISEQNIIVANNDRNGTRNGGQYITSSHSRAHIVITAAMVALGESFTFEHQNDPEVEIWDRGNYLYCPGFWGLPGPNPGRDRRGWIFIRGSVAQYRRGYVARSNCNRTGYEKNYYYDFRLPRNPPPVDLTAKTETGTAVFNILNSYDMDPARE